MKLEPCPRCGYNEPDQYGTYVACGYADCGLMGPRNDPDGEKWNELSRRVHGQQETERMERLLCLEKERANSAVLIRDAIVQLARNLHDAPQTPESGAMPWRLQIAAMIAAGCEVGSDIDAEMNATYALRRADVLIAAHKGGAA